MIVSTASLFESVNNIAGLVGPCSACPKRSIAQISGSEVLSAIISVSVGPANKSIPTLPNNCRLASATNILPGPTNISTPFIVSVPIAIAATACIPPRHRILSAPPICIAATIAGCGSPP